MAAQPQEAGGVAAAPINSMGRCGGTEMSVQAERPAPPGLKRAVEDGLALAAGTRQNLPMRILVFSDIHGDRRALE